MLHVALLANLYKCKFEKRSAFLPLDFSRPPPGAQFSPFFGIEDVSDIRWILITWDSLFCNWLGNSFFHFFTISQVSCEDLLAPGIMCWDSCRCAKEHIFADNYSAGDAGSKGGGFIFAIKYPPKIQHYNRTSTI